MSSKGTWLELADNGDEYPALSKGYTLDLPYKTLSVTSSGDSTFVRSSIIEFRSDSTFGFNKSASSSYEQLPFSAYAASDHGTYAIDGYLLTLRFADGRSEDHCLVNGGGDEWMIWIDDSLYCHLDADGDSSCSSD